MGLAVFLSAVLRIHLVCLDADPPGALQTRCSSSSRAGGSPGGVGTAAITANSWRMRISSDPMRTEKDPQGAQLG